MGYALFTARKLALTARLNLCNANLMALSEKEFSISQSIFEKQKAKNLASSQANLSAQQEYVAALKNGEDNIVAKAKLDEKLAEVQSKSTMSNMDIMELEQQQSLLDLEKKNLETQLKAFQSELEGVEKAEETAIKNSAPKFQG